MDLAILTGTSRALGARQHFRNQPGLLAEPAFGARRDPLTGAPTKNLAGSRNYGVYKDTYIKEVIEPTSDHFMSFKTQVSREISNALKSENNTGFEVAVGDCPSTYLADARKIVYDVVARLEHDQSKNLTVREAVAITVHDDNQHPPILNRHIVFYVKIE